MLVVLLSPLPPPPSLSRRFALQYEIGLPTHEERVSIMRNYLLRWVGACGWQHGVGLEGGVMSSKGGGVLERGGAGKDSLCGQCWRRTSHVSWHVNVHCVC